MKHQQVSVDYWAMCKAMAMYGFLAAMAWLMLRLFNTVVMLPRRLRNQSNNMEDTLTELQKRYPGLNFTEQDIKDAEKELEDIMKEQNDKTERKPIQKKPEDDKNKSGEIPQHADHKKTI